ncbi:MAG: hypothetical protein RL329_2018 [Bacteroidota bacterium]|jgi:hypothetical protein
MCRQFETGGTFIFTKSAYDKVGLTNPFGDPLILE